MHVLKAACRCCGDVFTGSERQFKGLGRRCEREEWYCPDCAIDEEEAE
jgi:hypothetical protein